MPMMRAGTRLPEFYAHMSDEELERHRARDNGLLKGGRTVTRAVYNLVEINGANHLLPEPPSLEDPVVGSEVEALGQPMRVACFHYEEDELPEELTLVISLTSDLESELEAPDLELRDEMEAFDAAIAEIERAGLSQEEKDALLMASLEGKVSSDG